MTTISPPPSEAHYAENDTWCRLASSATESRPSAKWVITCSRIRPHPQKRCGGELAVPTAVAAAAERTAALPGVTVPG